MKNPGVTSPVEAFRHAEPGDLNGALLALWWAGRGDWTRAHEIAQGIDGSDGAWVHAYLHRQEGDTANAGYWYRCAGQPVAGGDPAAEWERIVATLLQRR